MYNSSNLEDARAFRLYKFLENTARALKTYNSFLIIMRAFQYTWYNCYNIFFLWKLQIKINESAMFCEKIIELVYWMHSPWLSNPIGAGLLSDTEGYRPGSEPPGATSTKHTKVFFNNKENVLQLHKIQKTFWRNKTLLYKCKILSKGQVFQSIFTFNICMLVQWIL